MLVNVALDFGVNIIENAPAMRNPANNHYLGREELLDCTGLVPIKTVAQATNPSKEMMKN